MARKTEMDVETRKGLFKAVRYIKRYCKGRECEECMFYSPVRICNLRQGEGYPEEWEV